MRLPPPDARSRGDQGGQNRRGLVRLSLIHISNFTAVATALNNVGPGLELVGPVENFGFLHPLSKIVLMFDMLAGRLELFPMLLLFTPRTWLRKL